MYAPPPPPAQGRPALEVRQGPFFRYLLPAGWQVGEDGQYAVVLIPPDRRAVSAFVGNVGLPVGYPPHQFVFEKLMAFQPEQLQLGPPHPARPLPQFTSAWGFELSYAVGGLPCAGLARCHLAPAYDSVTMVMTMTASDRSQWPSYAPWLPELPEQTAATHPAALGAQAMAQQNLANAQALGQQLAAHRAWSQQTWEQVNVQRQRSQDQQAEARGDQLSGTQRYDNPYTGQTIDLPAQNQAYWVHPATGQIVGATDPHFDPRTAGDPGWQRLAPRSRSGR